MACAPNQTTFTPLFIDPVLYKLNVPHVSLFFRIYQSFTHFQFNYSKVYEKFRVFNTSVGLVWPTIQIRIQNLPTQLEHISFYKEHTFNNYNLAAPPTITSNEKKHQHEQKKMRIENEPWPNIDIIIKSNSCLFLASFFTLLWPTKANQYCLPNALTKFEFEAKNYEWNGYQRHNSNGSRIFRKTK